MKDIINNLKKSGTWKIQLTIANNIISSIDNFRERVMHLKSDNIVITLSSGDDKRMQSTDLIETYAYGMSKVLVSEKEDIKCSNIIKQYKK